MQIFKSKQDVWLVSIIYLSSFICLLAGTWVLLYVVSITSIVVAALTILLGGIAPIWLIVSLRYQIDQQYLSIVCGPFKWKIELCAITSVTPCNDMLASPALSLDRLRIVYGAGKAVLVSPQDKKRFIEALGKNEI